MTKTLGINESNDIFIGVDGKLSVLSDLDAVMQCCQTAAQAQLGEMVLAIDQGVPTDETVWTSSANVAQFEAYVRQAILTVAGVIQITDFSVIVQNNQVQYSATISTIFGNGALNV